MSDSKPSNTPVSVTQTLTALRLEHARLLEEHGASVALLRQREAELADFERRDAQAREMISNLEQNLTVANEKISRRETRTLIAEREVNFLQALVVSLTTSITLCYSRCYRRASMPKKNITKIPFLTLPNQNVSGNSKRCSKNTNRRTSTCRRKSMRWVASLRNSKAGRSCRKKLRRKDWKNPLFKKVN